MWGFGKEHVAAMFKEKQTKQFSKLFSSLFTSFGCCACCRLKSHQVSNDTSNQCYMHSIHIYDVLVALERKSDDFSHIKYIHHTTHESVPVPIQCTSAAEKRYLSIYIHCVDCCTHCIACELHSECTEGWTLSLQVSLCISPMLRTPALLGETRQFMWLFPICFILAHLNWLYEYDLSDENLNSDHMDLFIT